MINVLLHIFDEQYIFCIYREIFQYCNRYVLFYLIGNTQLGNRKQCICNIGVLLEQNNNITVQLRPVVEHSFTLYKHENIIKNKNFNDFHKLAKT